MSELEALKERARNPETQWDEGDPLFMKLRMELLAAIDALQISPLIIPTEHAREVFVKTLENNPDADMRAIPNEWLLRERSLSGQLGEQVDALQKERDEAIAERGRIQKHNKHLREMTLGMTENVAQMSAECAELVSAMKNWQKSGRVMTMRAEHPDYILACAINEAIAYLRRGQ